MLAYNLAKFLCANFISFLFIFLNIYNVLFLNFFSENLFIHRKKKKKKKKKKKNYETHNNYG